MTPSVPRGPIRGGRALLCLPEVSTDTNLMVDPGSQLENSRFVSGSLVQGVGGGSARGTHRLRSSENDQRLTGLWREWERLVSRWRGMQNQERGLSWSLGRGIKQPGHEGSGLGQSWW